MKIDTIKLILVLFLASLLRFTSLSSLPISLFGDEVDVGYHAISLLTTGRDYTGNLFPTYIKSLSESRAPLLMYTTAPFTGIFGLNAFGVRFFPAFMGVVNVLLIFLLSKILFPKQKDLPIFAATILALTPWHIHYSRAAFEVTLLITLILTGVIFYLHNRLIASAIFFVLTFYTYSTANIFTPLIVFILFCLHPRKFKELYKPLLLGTFLLFPLFINFFSGRVSERFGLISIFKDFGVTEEVVIKRNESWAKNQTIEKAFHNKYFVYLDRFVKNYYNSFSPQFLFLSGDPNYRHSVGAGVGEFVWPLAAPFIFGLYHLFKNISDKSNKLLLFWLLVSPLASALTVGGGTHATRLFIMIPPLVLIISLGVGAIYEFKKPFLLLLALTFFVTVQYLHTYSIHYRYLSFKEWNYGYKEIFEKLSPIQSKFSKIFINNTYQPSLLSYAFYTNLPPREFQKMFNGDQVVDSVYPEFNGFKFGDNIYFGEAISPLVIDHITKENGIYLSAQGREAPGNWNWIVDSPGGTKPLGGVYDPLGNPLFHLIVHKDNSILNQ